MATVLLNFQIIEPFNPHHTITDVALVGGGAYPQSGEIYLSHNGVLFLDKLPEFKLGVLEVMRQPLEDKEVTYLGLDLQSPIQVVLCW